MRRFLRAIARYWRPLLVLTVIAAVSAALYVASPQTILGRIGVENAYLLMFFLALLDGVSMFGAVPYQIIQITFAAGGLDPYLLAIVTWIGVMGGDTSAYFLGRSSREYIHPQMQRILGTLSRLQARYPRSMPFVLFFYGAATPLSNDWITVPLGLMQYPFWRMMIPLAAGNLVFNLVVCLLAAHSSSFLSFVLG